MYNKDDLIVVIDHYELDANIDDRIGIGGGGSGRGGLKWNIKASAIAPTNETPGIMGDIIVVTDDEDLVKKIKYIANRNPNSTDLIDNSITVYYDSVAERIVVNEISHFQCILQGKTQNVIVDGISYGLDVYFYDGYTHTWVGTTTAYRDNISINSFSGKDLDIDLTLSSIFERITESVVNDKRTPVVVTSSDTFAIDDFGGCDIDVATLMPSVFNNITESIAVTINGTPVN